MNKDKSTALIALTTAAIMLQGASKKAEANEPERKTTFDYRYSHYAEGAIEADKLSYGSADRYVIDVNQFVFKTSISADTDIQIAAVQESMSGASPWYIVPDEQGKAVQVMSGATIDEKRNEVTLDFHSFNTKSESTLSAGYSVENDYRSLSFGFAGAMNFDNKLTTLSYGINTAKDYIDASDADETNLRPTEEVKNRLGMTIGVSRVLTKNTLVNASISYSLLDGYLSDTYKNAFVAGAIVHDSRPDSTAQTAATIMLREFFPSANAALHLDYRYYTNDWELDSHTLELSWYQNLGKGWQLIPSARFYEQTATAFYQPFYLQERLDGYYSSDYRLSEFSANSGQLKLQKSFDAFSINIAYEAYTSSGDNPALISYDFYTLGMGMKF